MLKVRVAEMNRSAVKQFGVNLLSHDATGGTLFSIGRGNPGTINTVNGKVDPATGLSPESIQDVTFNNLVGGTTLGLFGKILGLDVLGTLDLLAERRRHHDPRRA